jgi:hypothetical protein
MARKCYRQNRGTHLIFVGEQFLGEGCPGVLDSNGFRAPVIFGRLVLNCRSGQEISSDAKVPASLHPF